MEGGDGGWGRWVRNNKLATVGACRPRRAGTACVAGPPRPGEAADAVAAQGTERGGLTGGRAAGCVWASGIAGSLAYNWSKRIPTSLKIIHSRVYAQAITLGALGVVGVIETFLAEQNPDLKPVQDEQGRVWR